MKAVVKFDKGRKGIELRDIPKPEPKADELLIKVMAAGICGTDLHIMQDEYPYKPPVVLGHEYTGIVEGMGKDVTGFKEGEQVISLTAAVTCGHCRFCYEGRLMLCGNRLSIGSGINGAMAEYIVVPAEIAFHLPPGVSGDSLAVSEPAACSVRAILERAPTRAGDVVVVSGPGIIGQTAAQMAKAAGAFVIMSGTAQDQKRLEIAKKIGSADEITTDPSSLPEIAKKYNSYGADIAVECAGVAASANALMDCLRKGGSYMQMGVFGKEVTLPLDKLAFLEATYYTNNATARSSWDLLLQLLAQKKVSLEPFAQDVYSIDDWDKAFEAAINKDGFKILIKP